MLGTFIPFPLQQWLHTPALLLRYKFIACLPITHSVCNNTGNLCTNVRLSRVRATAVAIEKQ